MTEVMGFNIFDLIVVALIVLVSIKGLLSGFVKELFSAIGLIGGIYVAANFNSDVAQYIYGNVTDSLSMPLLKVIATVVIFIVVWYVASLIGKGLSLIGESEYISATSRLGGMLVKMITLFLIFSLITFALSTKPQISERFKDTLASSKLYPILRNMGALILNASVPSSQVVAEENSSSVADSNTTTLEQNSTQVDATTQKSDSKVEESEPKVEQNSSVAANDNNETNSSNH